MRRLGMATLFAALGLSSGAVAQEKGATPRVEGWTGEFSVGGSMATGNTERSAFDADMRLNRRKGRVENRYRLLGDVAWDQDVTTAKRVQGSAQTNVDLREKLYGFGLGQLTDDRFSGFKYEAELGVGLGYRLIDTRRTALSVEAGPGMRFREVRATEDRQAVPFVRFFATFRHEMSDNARLTNETLVTVDHTQTRAENTIAVTSKLVGDLSGRVSFNVRHNTNPEEGFKPTDTLTKISLVYAF